MGTLPQLIAFQPPQMNLGETYTTMARLAAYDQARRAGALELEEKRGQFDREAQWRQLMSQAFQPQAPTTGPSFATAQPQPAAPAPQAPGMPPTAPGGFTMAQAVPPATAEQGSYAQMPPPGGVPQGPIAYGNAPMDLQSRVGLENIAGPVDTTQPPLQGGGFTQAQPGTVAQRQVSFTQPGAPAPPQGFTAPQPTKPLGMSVPGLMPMPNTALIQQAMALNPEKTSQMYGAYLTQRGKQLEEVDRNNKLVYQVTGAILDQPEYYQEGIDRLKEQGVPVPANMPPTFNRAYVSFQHKMAEERMSPLQEAQMEQYRAEAGLKRQQTLTAQQEQAALERVRPGGAGAGTGPQAPGGPLPASGNTAVDAALTENSRLYNIRLPLLQSIAKHESNYDPAAVSPKGATGVMQLMPGTAKDMGVDDPKDPTQNVRGGTRYFAQLLTKYGGNEALALAAYNAGPGAVDKAGGDLTKLPAETQAYVKNVLASAGGGAPAGTSPAPPPTAVSTNPEGQRLKAEIAEHERVITSFQGIGTPGVNREVDNRAAAITRLQNRLNQLEEPQRAAAKEQALYDLKRQQQSGPLLPEDRRKLIMNLRSDIRQEPTFKTYQDVRNGYQNVQEGATANNAQGDLAIVYGIAKILDPGSVVREGEFATVEGAQGRLQQIMNTTQKFFTGDRLTPENRQRFLEMAQRLAKQKTTTAEQELRKVYEPFAKEGNFDFGQLLPIGPLEPMPAGVVSDAGKSLLGDMKRGQ